MEQTNKPIIATSKKRQRHKLVPKGRIYIKATYNNTIITATDLAGNVLAWASAGKLGFKGPKKATPYVASLIVQNLMERIREQQLKEVEVLIKGIGAGRDAAVRALHANNLIINSIKDITPMPHNGCRAPKQRRV